MKTTFSVSAPGRICLFGEHQDYLNLPVITQAIDLRLQIQGHTIPGRQFEIDLPDIGKREVLPLPKGDHKMRYVKERDYFRAVYNVLTREGLRFEHGISARLTSGIPIKSGTSSSSALCVAWTRFLLTVAENVTKRQLKSDYIGHVAYLAEVQEFGEPGGMMDQYASALGGTLYQDFAGKTVKLKPLSINTGPFVLGDSLQPKDTHAILHRVKDGVLNAVKKIKKHNPNFDLEHENVARVAEYDRWLTSSESEVLTGALLNRDITREAKALLENGAMDDRQLGALLTRHQRVLADYSKISTPKIDAMLEAAQKAGALGGKINGSGGGRLYVRLRAAKSTAGCPGN